MLISGIGGDADTWPAGAPTRIQTSRVWFNLHMVVERCDQSVVLRIYPILVLDMPKRRVWRLLTGSAFDRDFQ